MGTWSHDAFGNDTACDWLAALIEQQTLGPVSAAIDTVVASATEQIDADQAVEAVAAIEVLARLRGHPENDSAYTESLDEWARSTRFNPPPGLIETAVKALNAIGSEQSELRQLWDESGDSEWHRAIDGLRVRLQATPKPLRKSAATSSPDADSAPFVQTLERLQKLRFERIELAKDAPMTELYQATVIAGAMGDADLVREYLSRLWQPAAHAKQQKILWDLAVREAQAWAMHGYLDEALTQLEYWRDTPEARTESHFEGRAAVVCLFARDIERARLHYQKSVAAAPEDITPRIDRALMEARFGPINIATQAFAEVRPLMSNTQPGRNLVPGILACRTTQPEALELLTASVDEFVAHARSGAAAWSILGYCVGWWALALHQHGHTNFARKAVAAVAPILLNALHTDLVTELSSAELVPGDTTLSPFPVPLKQGEQAIRSSSELTEHIGFKTRCVRGVNALQAVLKYRDEYAKNKGLYPFLIGSHHEVSDLLENISPPDDEGKSGLSAARELNVDQWFKDHKIKPPKSWPRQTIPPTQYP